MTRRLAAVAAVAFLPALAALLGGCASALKPLEPDSDLAQADPSRADPAAAAELAAAAEQRFEERPDFAAVRAAEELWLRSALADARGTTGVIGLSRARTWLAHNLENPEERREMASEAVKAAQWCGEREPENRDCPYWLALAVGVQAEQRRGTALDGLDVIVDLLHQAIVNHEDLDYAGPRRVLALVLLRAPGWPSGPGDPDEGLEHARRAVELFPEFPANLLALAEAYAGVEDSATSRVHYRQALRAAIAWRERGHPDAEEWVSEAEAALGR